MAKNPPVGDNARKGAVRDRSQTYNTKTQQWVSVILKPGNSWMSSMMGLLLKEFAKKSSEKAAVEYRSAAQETYGWHFALNIFLCKYYLPIAYKPLILLDFSISLRPYV